MSDLVIATRGLRKVYRSRGRRLAAVDGLDLAVSAGGVHGFLGPNGAGKTTTIRMLLGLTRPSGGEMDLFGLSAPEHLPEVIGRIGAVVDGAGFVPSFSGRKNLRLLAAESDAPPKAVDAALDRVGLADRAGSSYRSYSQGMRQRLALAAALLKAPDLLILDEPTNGLDPAGIRDMRELIRGLGAEGVTILLSSHILAEVQQVCDAVSVVGDGRLIATGTVEGLLGEAVARTRVGVEEPERAAMALRDAGYTVTGPDERGELVVEGHEHPEQITRILAGEELFVHELSAIRPDLESVFLRLTGREMPVREPADEVDPDAEDDPDGELGTELRTGEERG